MRPVAEAYNALTDLDIVNALANRVNHADALRPHDRW
jgi:hypothetical protein